MSTARLVYEKASDQSEDTMGRHNVGSTSQRVLIPSEFFLGCAQAAISDGVEVNLTGADVIGSQPNESLESKSATYTGYVGAIGAPWTRSLPGPAEIRKLDAPRRSPATLFYPRQEWEGVVEAVEESQIRARLYTILGDSPGEAPLTAEIPNEEIADADRKVMRPGSVFRWSIGYKKIGATKERVSVLVFRQLPQWTATDMTRADEIAQRLGALFGDDK